MIGVFVFSERNLCGASQRCQEIRAPICIVIFSSARTREAKTRAIERVARAGYFWKAPTTYVVKIRRGPQLRAALSYEKITIISMLAT
jgi:hypothetical protein